MDQAYALEIEFRMNSLCSKLWYVYICIPAHANKTYENSEVKIIKTTNILYNGDDINDNNDASTPLHVKCRTIQIEHIDYIGIPELPQCIKNEGVSCTSIYFGTNGYTHFLFYTNGYTWSTRCKHKYTENK